MSKPELSKTYTPGEVEEKIYKLWMESGAFRAVPDDREDRYVIMMPLPNVTGALHMGHAMDNCMQDLLVRWHRMMGDNALWMPGTDHAGIATQAVVEKRLNELEGLTRHDVGRDGLIERIWQWKDQYQARIIAQQKKMGCCCDWEKQRFTMDKVCARAVRHTFFRMFGDGLIFRGKRLVNWDVFLRTTISDDEMYYETVDGHFWHLKYPIIDPKEGEPEYVTVATTRPETMLGDTAVAVHPEPEKVLENLINGLELLKKAEKFGEEEEAQLAALKERRETILPQLLKLRDMAKEGRMVNLPLLNRPIPLICDEWAKPEKGSGCVKITPAHDPNDYDVWTRHKEDIGIINILNPDGTFNDNAGPYKGMERYVIREKLVKDLKEQDLLDRIEDHEVEIGHSDRSKTPIEPYLSDQWYVKMGDVEGGIRMGRGTSKEFNSPGLVQAAMDAVTEKRVQIHPERYTKTYLDWLSEKRDWPISRQLWWGHRIPIWSKIIKKGGFAEEKVFKALSGVINNRPEAAGEFLVRLNGVESEISNLIEGNDIAGITAPDWHETEDCRVDICPLGDNEDLIEIIESYDFEHETDVLDTWFSSALWPFSTLGWPDPETAEIEEGQYFLGSNNGKANALDYYYPGSCLVTARDIITLWVARMVLAGLYNLGDIPFSDVFIHANILDGKGVRMSKSKGNGIDPVDIIDSYGTDAMRYVLCDMQTGTQDIRLPVMAVCPVCGYRNDLAITRHGSNIFCYVCGKNSDGSLRKGSCGAEFDVLGTLPDLPAAKPTSERFDIGRAFCTKLWNSARFAFMNMENVPSAERTIADLALEDRWILNQLNKTILTASEWLKKYNPSFAINAIREFFWSALCDWYLELIKPRLYGKDNRSGGIARQVLALCLDQVIRLLHPFIPYITEHLWQSLNQYVPERGLGPLAPVKASEFCISAQWPTPFGQLDNNEIGSRFAYFQEITRAVREVRSARNIPPKEKLVVTLKPTASRAGLVNEGSYVIKELAGVKELKIDEQAKRLSGSASKLVTDCEIFIHDVIDDSAEIARLKKALADAEKEIAVCEKKLSNPNFVDRAPTEVIKKQKDRLAEHRTNKTAIEQNLKTIDNS